MLHRKPAHLIGVGLDFEWGRSRIGQQSDFDGYLDTGNGAPGTEVAVAAAHTFDVTLASISHARSLVGQTEAVP